jgi:hypothetical protein
MANSKYLKVTLDGQPLDLSDTDVQVSISYQQEDTEDFSSKKSSEAFSITVPASVNNDQLSNTLHNPSVEDMTSGQVFRGYRKGIIEANGDELLIGKAVLVSATHTDRPVSYEYNFYGNNGDWIIPLKETTLYDLLKHIKFEFTSYAIEQSWLFNGYSEDSPFVFAPVRYRAPFDYYDETITDADYKDDNVTPLYMKPALSVYWILYWGFKLAGYKIQSSFFDTDYFRRLVMPWTWGNFLNAEGNRQDNLKFLAKGSQPISFTQPVTARYVDVKADNESTDGAYDNNGVYLYSPSDGAMLWVYPLAFNYGKLKVTFNLQVDWNVSLPINSELQISVHWFLNETLMDSNDIVHTSTPGNTGYVNSGVMDDSFTVEVDALGTTNSRVSARIWVNTGGFNPTVALNIIQFTITDIATPLGGTIDFQNYNGLKNHKFLDLLAGVIDSFNLIPGSDPVNKVALIEPAHSYSLTNTPSATQPGYFNGDYIDWSVKQDLSKLSTITLFSDYERELTMKFKDDSNDGILKLIQDRNKNTLAAGKYVFPERFKAEKKDIENRFFSPVMHYEPSQWQAIGDTGKKIQMICIVPENVSNTSNDEAGNTFQPKLAYYKGMVTDAGGWRYNGIDMPIYPFMFAVNYQEGSQGDPVLSYSDEKIGNGKVPGLLRRFFLQRFAIMRNGQFYTQTYFRLTNRDATNWFHREHKICRGERWELVKMTDYRPLTNQSTECYLRKWSPITETDYKSVYPSFQPNNIDQFDIKYSPLKCLASDIPGPLTQ